MPDRVRTQPCEYCPYKKSVPSGVWAEHEYDKLVEYDKETWEQPWATFGCHATPEFFCHGWAVVHSNRGHQFDLLALRVAHFEGEIPPPAVPLFASGTEAAEHGKQDILQPESEARAAMARLVGRYPRLSKENDDAGV